jgi:tetratricopeptide (TPR) repeat protein
MGRSFYRASRANVGEGSFYHQASGQHFTMSRRDDRILQRRHQIGADGSELNIVEKEVHFVLGSGNHARTFLHRTAGGQLVELPLAWYADKGGFWGMNPGYDRADHMDFRRKIDQECFFCHNAYPTIAASTEPSTRALTLKGAVPEGIDCQRCHGPGREHIDAVRAREPTERIRRAIVNPGRLSRTRQLEVCMQCHLETTSRRLPYSIRRYGRGFFSYRAGEPLEDYILHFDRAPGTGYDDSFEISHAAYRLMKSACFRESETLTCTTCHNPHEALRGEEATRHYVWACQTCHVAAHNASENCLTCHMPKRRAEDVVHAVMTDHFIQRRKPDRDLLASLSETHDTDQTAYKGEVVLFYPPRLPATVETERYLAVAQVIDGSNLQTGILRLRKSIETDPPREPEFYFELANAYWKSNQSSLSLPYYKEALRLNPHFSEARRSYAAALASAGRHSEAVTVLEAVALPASDDAAILNALGSAYLNSNRLDPAIAVLRRALRLDPDLPEIHVNLGTALSRRGDQSGAIAALRNAIRARPGSAVAHTNLGSILQQSGDTEQAKDHFRNAIRIEPDNAMAHYNYGRALAEQNNLADAELELAAALRIDPRLVEATVVLGRVMEQRGEGERAIEQYRKALAIRPDLTVAHFNLGLILLRRGERAAKQHFQFVVQSDPRDLEAHLYLGRTLMGEKNYDAAIVHLEKAARSGRAEVRGAALDALRTARSLKGVPDLRP